MAFAPLFVPSVVGHQRCTACDGSGRRASLLHVRDRGDGARFLCGRSLSSFGGVDELAIPELRVGASPDPGEASLLDRARGRHAALAAALEWLEAYPAGVQDHAAIRYVTEVCPGCKANLAAALASVATKLELHEAVAAVRASSRREAGIVDLVPAGRKVSKVTRGVQAAQGATIAPRREDPRQVRANERMEKRASGGEVPVRKLDGRTVAGRKPQRVKKR